MDVDIYESKVKRNRFLIVKRNSGARDVPTELGNEFKLSKPFRQIALDPSTHLIGLDPSAATAAVERVGYCVAETSVKITER